MMISGESNAAHVSASPSALPACVVTARLRQQSPQPPAQARFVPRNERNWAARRSFSISAAAAEHVEAEYDGESAIELSDARFHTIRLDGCEFLMATTPDDKLDLREVYVRDGDTDIFARPRLEGQLPELPTRFLEMEWAEEYSGDTLMQKEGWRKVKKVYLLEIQELDPYRVNLEKVYSIDNSERVLRQEVVQRATEETDPTLITLRIRPEGLTIENNSDLIDDWELVEQYWADIETERIAKAGQAAGTSAKDITLDETSVPRDPIDALNDDDREYDESFEDTPAVDQGY